MTPSKFSRHVALASAVSFAAIACSPINAQSNVVDTADVQESEQTQVKKNKGVKIVKGENYVFKSKDGKIHRNVMSDEGGDEHHMVFKGEDGHVTMKRFNHDGKREIERVIILNKDEGEGEPHKIKITKNWVDGKNITKVEGGELSKDSEGNEIVTYTDDKGKKHEFKVKAKHHKRILQSERRGEHGKKIRMMRHAKDGKQHAPRVHKMRMKLHDANSTMEKAMQELELAKQEVAKELAAVKDKDSAEYMGLEIAKEAIDSAMNSLGEQRFDEKRIEIEIRKMDKQIMHHLKDAMKDVHEQRKIIVDLQGDIHDEVEGARQELRTMIIEIEGMDEGEERMIRLHAIEEMDMAMGDMAEHRLKALKRAEEELRKSRIELEKQIAEQKAKAAEADKKATKKPE